MLWASLLSARSFASSTEDLLARSWSPGSDTRQQSVQALLQTRDGYLWIGTGKGLLRFDGVTFTSFTTENTPGMAGDDISFDALWEDKSGVLWIGTPDQGLIRNDHGRFQTFGKEQGLPNLEVLRIDGDDAGTVWVFTSGGVVRWRNGQLERVDLEREDPVIPHSDRRTRDFDVMGLWRHTPSGLERFSYGKWRRFPTPPGEHVPFENDIRSIYEDRLQRVWYSVHSQPGVSFCVRHGELRTFRGVPPSAFVSFQDRSGYLWMNDHGGHPARWKAGRVFPLPQLRTASLLNVLQAADGVIWAGGYHSDLVEYRQKLISSLPTAGMPEVGPVIFRQRNGDIWTGSTALLKMQEAPRRAHREVTFAPLGSSRAEWNVIRSLSEDEKGRLLVGSMKHPGGQLLDRGKLRPYLPQSFDHGTILAMLLASNGEQWIGTDHGLYRYSSQNESTPELLLQAYLHCITETSRQIIWVGTTEGLQRFQSGRAEALPESAPWFYGEVYGITEDRSGDLWIATSRHGIVHYTDGTFRAFDSSDGLPTNDIYSVDFDAAGDLWLRSDVGLMHIRRQSVAPRGSAKTGKLQVTLLDGADGVPASDMTPPGPQGFLAFAKDTLWFASPGGIASLHPSDFPFQAGSPRAILEEHVIDQSGRAPGTDIVLHPGQRNLELHYTALGSRRPEQLTFRYRLLGYDHGWTVAGTRRVAYYTQLPPGAYSFEVQAANGDDDAWGATGATAAVHVLTPFYRTWWMKALLCCIALGTVLSITRARRRIAAERARSRQAFTHRLIATQEGERKRIAHELHDSLGQHLVLIRTLALLAKVPTSAPRPDHVEKIADQAAVAIQEIEAISYDLRPYQLDRLGLTKAIKSLLDTFEASTSVRLTQNIENIDGSIPKDVEINLYRIIQEALGNILKHAEATEVSVTIAHTSSSVRLEVTDNGRGFVPSASISNQGGLGLIGIEERAEALGGHAVIESADRAGTKVIVTLERSSQRLVSRS